MQTNVRERHQDFRSGEVVWRWGRRQYRRNLAGALVDLGQKPDAMPSAPVRGEFGIKCLLKSIFSIRYSTGIYEKALRDFKATDLYGSCER